MSCKAMSPFLLPTPVPHTGGGHRWRSSRSRSVSRQLYAQHDGDWALTCTQSPHLSSASAVLLPSGRHVPTYVPMLTRSCSAHSGHSSYLPSTDVRKSGANDLSAQAS
ncbi:hypothetical protein PAXRUDRAFT_225393 [Paxillus rubicundulus Ve08.2h10]|uniref:Uncharacterized protein n=1 Tax=Paxillus rubicundulus Ve08.2h10 TaxID=930991 RepID=A0A0D0DH71_9AGAM|nr:hypothetical protein PAXRUDRAFT_225393 [Paxillus rubicundulus Ve08.2h10]